MTFHNNALTLHSKSSHTSGIGESILPLITVISTRTPTLSMFSRMQADIGYEQFKRLLKACLGVEIAAHCVFVTLQLKAT